MSLDAIICSITYVKEMSLSLAGSFLLLFLKTRLTVAFVQSDGILPVDNDFWESS